MVGGTVIGLVRKPGEPTMLHIRDRAPYNDQICVDVTETHRKDGSAVEIAIGDSVWWQCGLVMWTPKGANRRGKCGRDFDIQLPKVGYTYASSHAMAGED